MERGSGAVASSSSRSLPVECWPRLADVFNAVPASNPPGSILHRRTGDAAPPAFTFPWSQPRPSMYRASKSSTPHQGPGAAYAEALWDHVTPDSEELAHQAWGVTETSHKDGRGAGLSSAGLAASRRPSFG
ncbi:uncharacterized protein LOC144168783 [Haemaphysalis longicornis]